MCVRDGGDRIDTILDVGPELSVIRSTGEHTSNTDYCKRY